MLTPACSYIYSRNCRLFPASIRLETNTTTKMPVPFVVVFLQRAMVPLHKGMAPTFSIGAITARNGLRASSPGIWDEPLGEQIYLTQKRDVKIIVGTFLRTNLLPLAA